MWILAADLAALLAAPGLDALVRRSPGWSAFVTDLCRAAVAGIVVLHLLPDAWRELGVAALLLFVGGAAGVVWVERWTSHRESTVFGWAAAALGAHHLADGVGLAFSATEPELGTAVVLHALPVALVAWRLGVAQGGARIGWAIVAWIALWTVLGYAVGALGAGLIIEPVAVGVSCALGGGLLHALSHVPHDEHHPRASGLGVIVALIGVVLLAVADQTVGGLGTMDTIARLVLVSAPALLLGFVLAGVAAMVVTGLPFPAWVLSFPLLGVPLAAIRLGVTAALAAVSRPTAETGPARDRTARGWQIGAVELPDRILPWFGAGLVVAALLEPLLDSAAVATIPSFVQVPALAALATPVVLCAVGITPVAALLFQHGVSAGATLAFLVAGPARGSSGWNKLAIGVGATALGLVVDAVLPGLAPVVLPGIADHGPVAWVSSTLLGLLAAASLLRQGATAFVARIGSPFIDPATHPH